MASLTNKRLKAIVEALNARLCGEIDIEGEEGAPKRKDYATALEWANEKLTKKSTDEK